MDQTKYEPLKVKTDIVFQTLFSRVNKNITKAFLSDILKMEIKDINLNVDRNLVKQYPEEKLGVLDLRAELNDGIQCDVEIQLTKTKRLIERLLSYWARLYVEKLERGDEYHKLKRTICVLILDDRIDQFKEIASSYTRWQIREEKNNMIILTKDLEIVIIELPKAIKEYKKRPGDKTMQWMQFIAEPESKEVVEIMEKNKDIKKAKEKLEELNQDEELRRLAFLRRKWELDYKDQMLEAEETGLERGMKKGRKEGVEEGKREAIQKMQKVGMRIEQIAEILEMPKEEIERLLSKK